VEAGALVPALPRGASAAPPGRVCARRAGRDALGRVELDALGPDGRAGAAGSGAKVWPGCVAGDSSATSGKTLGSGEAACCSNSWTRCSSCFSRSLGPRLQAPNSAPAAIVAAAVQPNLRAIMAVSSSC
jgi:hypothetical protein